MAKRRTLEEKECLIKEFKNSGHSIKKWCETSGISPSTMSGWINQKTQRKHLNNDIRFIEVPNTIPESIAATASITSIIIKCNSVEIEVTENTDFNLLRNIIKVVKSVNV